LLQPVSRICIDLQAKVRIRLTNCLSVNQVTAWLDFDLYAPVALSQVTFNSFEQISRGFMDPDRDTDFNSAARTPKQIFERKAEIFLSNPKSHLQTGFSMDGPHSSASPAAEGHFQFPGSKLRGSGNHGV
jgi:hypothetical protein